MATISDINVCKVARENITLEIRVSGLWRFKVGLVILRLGAWVSGANIELKAGDSDAAR